MESNSKLISDGVKSCGQFVNSQRAIRYRAPLKGQALRRQAVRVWNEVMGRINHSRIKAGLPGYGCYA